jgi:hypothetical protein
MGAFVYACGSGAILSPPPGRIGEWGMDCDFGCLKRAWAARLFGGLVCVYYELLSYDAFYAVSFLFICAFCCG